MTSYYDAFSYASAYDLALLTIYSSEAPNCFTFSNDV